MGYPFPARIVAFIESLRLLAAALAGSVFPGHVLRGRARTREIGIRLLGHNRERAKLVVGRG